MYHGGLVKKELTFLVLSLLEWVSVYIAAWTLAGEQGYLLCAQLSWHPLLCFCLYVTKIVL